MTEEVLLNFQYGKILTNKLKIKDYVYVSNKYQSETINISEIEILSLLLIDYDNYYNREINSEDNDEIKKYLNHLNDDTFEKKAFKTNDVYKIYEIGENKKIDPELNKLIAIKYAEYCNQIDLLNPIGIDIIKKLY